MFSEFSFLYAESVQAYRRALSSSSFGWVVRIEICGWVFEKTAPRLTDEEEDIPNFASIDFGYSDK